MLKSVREGAGSRHAGRWHGSTHCHLSRDTRFVLATSSARAVCGGVDRRSSTTRFDGADTAMLQQDMPLRDDELAQALYLLVHEVRTPLGVASGYLRLVMNNRLTSPEDQAAALAQSLDALGRISRLCDDASSYVTMSALDRESSAAAMTLPAADLAARVAKALSPVAFLWTVGADLRGSVRCASQGDELSSAVATILGSVRRPSVVGVNLAVTVVSDSTQLYFLAGTDEQRGALMEEIHVPLDPWRGGYGLALPLAYRRILQSGGDAWTTQRARPGVGLSLPLEDSAL